MTKTGEEVDPVQSIEKSSSSDKMNQNQDPLRNKRKHDSTPPPKSLT